MLYLVAVVDEIGKPPDESFGNKSPVVSGTVPLVDDVAYVHELVHNNGMFCFWYVPCPSAEPSDYLEFHGAQSRNRSFIVVITSRSHQIQLKLLHVLENLLLCWWKYVMEPVSACFCLHAQCICSLHRTCLLKRLETSPYIVWSSIMRFGNPVVDCVLFCFRYLPSKLGVFYRCIPCKPIAIGPTARWMQMNVGGSVPEVYFKMKQLAYSKPEYEIVNNMPYKYTYICRKCTIYTLMFTLRT